MGKTLFLKMLSNNWQQKETLYKKESLSASQKKKTTFINNKKKIWILEKKNIQQKN